VEGVRRRWECEKNNSVCIFVTNLKDWWDVLIKKLTWVECLLVTKNAQIQFPVFLEIQVTNVSLRISFVIGIYSNSSFDRNL
jgi:hypothetical protein